MIRYLKIRLSDEDVIRWERGLYLTALYIRREMNRHGLAAWPTLVGVGGDIPAGWPPGWELLFAWAEDGRAYTPVSKGTAAHVPHRHREKPWEVCDELLCHALGGGMCAYCGGAPCRVELAGAEAGRI